jgi:LAS superfamily LD-carboxypeptidase LdcB
MDDITALEYHIDEYIGMDNLKMDEDSPKSERVGRRDFLKTVCGSMFGIFVTVPVIPSFISGKQSAQGQDQGLAKVELPAKSSLPDALLTRIIDTTHPITEDEITRLIQPHLIPIPDKFKGIRVANENVRVHSLLMPSLENLFAQANTDQTGLFIHSGFRTYEEQAIAYSQAKDKLVVMKPGTSQHHSGLALDFTSSDIGKLIDIGLHFESTKAGKWLNEHAWEYGFVRSYTGSHDGIKDEPWHYLFVGKELAEAYNRLKTGGWYGDVFLLQLAVNLGFRQIMIEIP